MNAEDAEALRAGIEQKRSELGETAEALAAKADVKGRAKEAVEHKKEQLSDKAGELAAKTKEQAAAVRTRFAEVPDELRERSVSPLLVGVVGVAAIAIAVYAAGRARR